MPDKQPAVFVDRDGTLVEEVNYLSHLEDLNVFSFTRPALEMLRAKNFLVVVVTNQSGIGRGIYTEEAMHSIHREMDRQHEGLVDRYYFCPHLPGDGCECRKPRTGMIRNAASDLGIDLGASWMIGDKKIDVETGFSADLRTALVLTGYGRDHRSTLTRHPDVVADDLLAAAIAITAETD